MKPQPRNASRSGLPFDAISAARGSREIRGDSSWRTHYTFAYCWFRLCATPSGARRRWYNPCSCRGGGAKKFRDQAHLRRLPALPGRWSASRDPRGGALRDRLSRDQASTDLVDAESLITDFSRSGADWRDLLCAVRRALVGIQRLRSRFDLPVARAVAPAYSEKFARRS